MTQHDTQYDKVELRAVAESDIPQFFFNHIDPEASYMCAFVVTLPSAEQAFTERWQRLLSDTNNTIRTVVVGGRVAGSVLSFPHGDTTEVGYWLGREFWGRGIATQALEQFLRIVLVRPLHARVAHDNTGSIRVLEKCGFAEITRETSYAEARGEHIEELIMRLDSTEPFSLQERL